MEGNCFLTDQYTSRQYTRDEALGFRTAQLRALYLVHNVLAQPGLFAVISDPNNLKIYFPRVTKNYKNDVDLFVDFMRFISEIDVNNPLCYHDYLEAVRNMDFDKQSYSTLHQKSIDDENIPVFDMKAYINLICEVKDNKVIGFSKKIKVKEQFDNTLTELTNAVTYIEKESNLVKESKILEKNERNL